MTPARRDGQSGPNLLIVDDDRRLCDRLARAMQERGFDTATAYNVADGRDLAMHLRPSFAVVDLRLEDGSGLEVIEALREARRDVRAVVLTGYANIATAVAAVKIGAVDYLAKPADADQVEAALREGAESLPPPPEQPMTADRARWEHIHRIYEQCGRNVSETARRLRMHRRTLQRILSKRAPP